MKGFNIYVPDKDLYFLNYSDLYSYMCKNNINSIICSPGEDNSYFPPLPYTLEDIYFLSVSDYKSSKFFDFI